MGEITRQVPRGKVLGCFVLDCGGLYINLAGFDLSSAHKETHLPNASYLEEGKDQPETYLTRRNQ